MSRSANVLLGLGLGVAATATQLTPARAHAAPSLAASAVAAAQRSNSSISGRVYGEGRRPLSDVWVELLDDAYSTLRRVRTNAGGQFMFTGLPQGRYKVRVTPYGTDYREETRDVELITVSAIPGSSGAISEQVDIQLRMRADANASPLAAPGSVFAQEVPEEARKLYEAGVASLRDKKEKEGFESLKHALEIFPTYYAALDRLGTEYVMRGYHQAAYVLLTKALEVNPRSFSSNFGLGLAQYYLKQNNEAVESLRRATSIYAKSAPAQMWLGVALQRRGDLAQAESSYKQARDLSDGKLAEVHWHLGRLYMEQKRYNEAASSLELFLKAQPDARDAEKIKQLITQLRQKGTGQP